MLKSLFNAMEISSAGVSVQRTRMNVISENIANAETTRTPEGEAYRRKIPVVQSGSDNERFQTVLHETVLKMDRTQHEHMREVPFERKDKCCSAGVHVSEIVRDPSELRMEYDPSHPDADENGYVAMPNVNIIQEMTDLISATRSFEANVTAINSTKEMLRKAIKI